MYAKSGKNLLNHIYFDELFYCSEALLEDVFIADYQNDARGSGTFFICLIW